MAQAYSDPKRASEPGALPDVEVFYVSGNHAADNFDANDGTLTEPGWYWQAHGTHFNADGSCHPDCGPVVLDPYDVRGKAPLLNAAGEHAHESEADGRCWHESWCEPNGPFATDVLALADAQSGSDDDDDMDAEVQP